MLIPAHNPFTSTSRAEKQEHRIIDNHHDEKLRREEIREQGYQQNQRMQNTFKDVQRSGNNQQPLPGAAPQRNLAARGKYQFEADNAEDAMEDEIDTLMEENLQGVKRLHLISNAMNEELDHQNKMIEEIAAKSDAVDDRVITQTARLKRIK